MLIFLIFSLFIIILLSYFYNNYGLTSIKASDGHVYKVRGSSDNVVAVNTLVLLRKKLVQLVDYILDKMDRTIDVSLLRYRDYVLHIKEKLPHVEIKETPSHSNYTSYSVNKGQELYFCLRSKVRHQFHSINELLYVAIHEIAHIGCPEIGHTDLFYDINRFLLKQAMEFNIYHYHNYDIRPVEYCGINLNHSILNK